MTGTYIQALALGLDPAWRRLPLSQRRSDAECFAAVIDSVPSVRTFTYSMIGLQAGTDLLVWRLAPELDALEEAAAALLRTGLGTWLTVRESFIGLIGASQYVARATSQEQSLFEGERSRYLVVYPFTKSSDWYLLSKEVRQGVMNEHMKVGHQYPQVRQLLAYSFGPRRPGLRGCLRDRRPAGVRRAGPGAARDREPAIHGQRHADPHGRASADRRDPGAARGRHAERGGSRSGGGTSQRRS